MGALSDLRYSLGGEQKNAPRFHFFCARTGISPGRVRALSPSVNPVWMFGASSRVHAASRPQTNSTPPEFAGHPLRRTGPARRGQRETAPLAVKPPYLTLARYDEQNRDPDCLNLRPDPKAGLRDAASADASSWQHHYRYCPITPLTKLKGVGWATVFWPSFSEWLPTLIYTTASGRVYPRLLTRKGGSNALALTTCRARLAQTRGGIKVALASARSPFPGKTKSTSAKI
jgi:hypothetical protein